MTSEHQIPLMPQPQRMTKAERSEFGQLIRKRERVMKADAAERSAQMLAEFDAQSAAIYAFDDSRQRARIVSWARIPAECQARSFHGLVWPRAECHVVAAGRTASLGEIPHRGDRAGGEAQTQVIANGLESEAARTFLQEMPSLETLMPAVDAGEIKRLIDLRHQKKDDDW